MARNILLDHHDAPRAMEHPQRKRALHPRDLVVIQLHGIDAAAAECIILRVRSENGGEKNTRMRALGMCSVCFDHFWIHDSPSGCRCDQRLFAMDRGGRRGK